MTDHVFQDWMDAATDGNRPTAEAAIVADYITSLDLGVYHLPNLLRDMGPYLTQDSDLITVARALAIFPHILGGMGTEFGRQETHSLVEYFCARLENKTDVLNYRAGVCEVASSLHILSKWKNFLPGDAGTIAITIFELASGSIFKNQKPATRVKLYEVIDFLFKNFQKPLIRDVKLATLVSGLVSMAELEKNPSCLGILFPLYAHISQKWPLLHPEFKLIWDSFIRYFPVTVGGAAQDPAIPGKELLRDLLLQCILSNDSYAKEAIPRFIDMLDTSTDLSANVKTEVLATLVSCVSTYTPETLSIWSSKIWDSLKFEIWNGENEDFITGSLEVLRAMTTTFVGRTYLYETNNNFMFRFVVPIATECVQRFHDSKKQYLLPSGKILYSIASSSPYAFHLVIKTVLPAMQVVWQDLKLPSEKKMLLVVYNYILQARLNQPDITDSSPHSRSRLQDPAISKTFDEFREGIVEVYFGAVSNLTQEPSSSNMSFGAAAIQGLVLSFKIPEYLSNVEKGIVVRELNSMLATPPKDNDIRLAALSSLQEISAVEPKTFQDITLLNYLEMLPDNVSQDADERKVELDIIVGHLQDLVQIACSRPCQKELSGGPPANMPSSYWHRNFDTMEKKLLDKLDLVLQNNGHLDYANVILAAICGGLQIFDTNLNLARTKAQEPMPANPKVGPYTYIVTALFQKIVEQKDHPNGLAGAFELRYTGIKKPFDDKFVQMVGRIAMWALRSDLTTPANNFLLNWNALFPDEPSAIWTLFTPGTSLKSLSTSQQNLEHGPKDKCLANALSMYLLAGNRRTEPFMFVEQTSPLRIQIADVAAAMVRNSISADSRSSRFGRMCMLWMLQLLVSKYAAAMQLLNSTTAEEKPRRLLDVMTEEIKNCPKKSDREIKNTYQTLAYFAAASIASFDQSMVPLVNMMINALSDLKYGRKVAQSFRILLAESEVMNKANFCTIRALRFQKAVALVVVPLQSTYFSSTTSRLEKDNIVIALAGVLAYLDAELVADTFGFNAIMLEGTGVSDDEFTKETFIHLLNELIPLCPKKAEEHVDSIIRLMTDRTHNTYDSPSDASVRCRAKALDVLARLTDHLPAAVLLQRRAKLVPELDLALDDCSRDVRVKAQQTKMKWLRLGTQI